MRFYPLIFRIIVILALISAFFALLAENQPANAKCPSYMVLTCIDREKVENRRIRVEKRQNRRISVESLSGKRLGVVEELPTDRIRIYDRDGDVIKDFRILLPQRYWRN